MSALHTPSDILQYQMHARMTEAVLGDGSTTVTFTPAQLDLLAERLDGVEGPVAAGIRFLLDLNDRLPDSITAGQA